MKITIIAESKEICKLQGTKLPSKISIRFLLYILVVIKITTMPNIQENTPSKTESISMYEFRTFPIVKCKLVAKKPTPTIEIAVQIHAKYVRSFAKCC